MHKSRLATALGLVLAFALWACGAPADAEYIAGREYFPTVLTEIGNARSSITAAMYLFSLYPGYSQSLTSHLADALAAAKKRGVAVHIVMDKGEVLGRNDGDDPGADNRTACLFLKAAGIDVSLADVKDVMHAKAVVIDSATVIMGSTNWSEAGFSKNVETDMLVRSREVAVKTLDEIGKIPAIPVPDHDTAAVNIPAAFLTDTSYLGRMVTNRDERTFDIYLFLLLYAGGRPSSGRTLAVHYDSLAKGLGIDTAKPATYRAMIYEILGKLRDRYALVESYSQKSPNVNVTMKQAAGETVALPSGYFAWGWNRRLPFSAKVMAVLGLYYSSKSPTRPKWSLAVETIAERHGFYKEFAWTGTLALRRANLEDVEYFEVPRDTDERRHPNIYLPLPFYDPSALAAAWKRLEAKYGKDKTDRGRAYAGLVFKDGDARAVERFIRLEEQYGLDKMERASKTVGAMLAYNPKRSEPYFAAIVRNPK